MLYPNVIHLRRELSKIEKTYSLLVILVPFLVTLYSIFSGMLFNIHSKTILLFFICYSATVLGITLGFHRLLTHRSFKCNRFIKYILLCLGCMSYEGPPLFWVAAHRRHHKFTDQEFDPHSPLKASRSKWHGLFYAHIGWMLNHQVEDWNFYIKDLLADKEIRFINKKYLLIAISGLIIPGMINGIMYSSWYHFWEGVIICGFVRVFLQQNVTWAINSICHVWGKKDFITSDNSKNNWFLAILALGEGWHNGHHAFPSSAKHGLKKYQFDFSYMIIVMLSYVGAVWDIKKPNQTQLKHKDIRNHDLHCN